MSSDEPRHSPSRGKSSHAPQVVLIGGPNGAGKSTAAGGVLRDLLGLGEFVNADTIAAGLAGFAPASASFSAGRIMLQRLRELAELRADFAFETTMASKTFAPWLERLRASGYEVNLVFMWLSSPSIAMRRVRARARRGGHDVPLDVIRRRYHRGVYNFARIYQPIADRWRVYDNSAATAPRLIARGGRGTPTIISDYAVFGRIFREVSDGR